MNWLIYYNPTHQTFYTVYSKYIPDRCIDYENGYGHILVQILVPRQGKYVNVNSKYELAKIPWKKEKLKLRLINGLIRWLNRLKKEDRERI